MAAGEDFQGEIDVFGARDDSLLPLLPLLADQVLAIR